MLYLHTSPEFAAKKLLAAGETRIFDFARVFRNRERGALHAPEFTMLEWYRADEPYEAVQEDCLAAAAPRRRHRRGGGVPLPRPHLRSARSAAAPHRGAGLHLSRRHRSVSTLSRTGEGDRERLRREGARAGFAITDADNWSDIFSKVLTAAVEPSLGLGEPTLLTEYPRCEAALARATPHDPRVAERFELYCLRCRTGQWLRRTHRPGRAARPLRSRNGREAAHLWRALPYRRDFLAALEHMPDASGVALGFDRLVMLATGAPRIDDVLWTPAP